MRFRLFCRARVLIFVFWLLLVSCSDPLRVRLFTDGRVDREALQRVRRVDLVYKDARGQTLLKESRMVEQGIENSIEWKSRRLEELELEERGRFIAQGYTIENKMTFQADEIVQTQNKGILSLELRPTAVVSMLEQEYENRVASTVQNEGVEIFFEPQSHTVQANQCEENAVFGGLCTYHVRGKVILKNRSDESLKTIVRVWSEFDRELLISERGFPLQPREFYPHSVFVREYLISPKQTMEFFYFGQIDRKTRQNYFQRDRLNWTVDSFDLKEQRRQIKGDLLF